LVADAIRLYLEELERDEDAAAESVVVNVRAGGIAVPAGASRSVICASSW
jgi:hypothetical protein